MTTSSFRQFNYGESPQGGFMGRQDFYGWIKAKLNAGLVNPQAAKEIKKLLAEFEEKRIRGIL